MSVTYYVLKMDKSNNLGVRRESVEDNKEI